MTDIKDLLSMGFSPDSPDLASFPFWETGIAVQVIEKELLSSESKIQGQRMSPPIDVENRYSFKRSTIPDFFRKEHKDFLYRKDFYQFFSVNELLFA